MGLGCKTRLLPARTGSLRTFAFTTTAHSLLSTSNLACDAHSISTYSGNARGDAFACFLATLWDMPYARFVPILEPRAFETLGVARCAHCAAHALRHALHVAARTRACCAALLFTMTRAARPPLHRSILDTLVYRQACQPHYHRTDIWAPGWSGGGSSAVAPHSPALFSFNRFMLIIHSMSIVRWTIAFLPACFAPARRLLCGARGTRHTPPRTLSTALRVAYTACA